MADEEYHHMEMSRRSITITGVREELREIREREAEAKERLDQLDRQINSKQVHISICKANAQDMEDQAAAEEASCLQHQRLMQEDEEAVQNELRSLTEKLAKTAKSLEKAQADEMQARKAAEAQEEANRRQREEASKHAAHLAALHEATTTAAADVEKIQDAIRDLEVKLGMEKQTSKELQDSVKDKEDMREKAQLECNRLSNLLESLSARGNREELSKALAAVQREHLQLTQELATKQCDGLIKQQDIKGRLEETRRIHEERTQSAVNVDAKLNVSGPIAALMFSLEEEKKKADAAKEIRLRVEAESKTLENELQQLQGSTPTPAKSENNDLVGLEELRAAQEKFENAKRQLREKDEALQIGRLQLAHARQNARNSVEVLRAKLKELWVAIGQGLPC